MTAHSPLAFGKCCTGPIPDLWTPLPSRNPTGPPAKGLGRRRSLAGDERALRHPTPQATTGPDPQEKGFDLGGSTLFRPPDPQPRGYDRTLFRPPDPQRNNGPARPLGCRLPAASRPLGCRLSSASWPLACRLPAALRHLGCRLPRGPIGHGQRGRNGTARAKGERNPVSPGKNTSKLAVQHAHSRAISSAYVLERHFCIRSREALPPN